MRLLRLNLGVRAPCCIIVYIYAPFRYCTLTLTFTVPFCFWTRTIIIKYYKMSKFRANDSVLHHDVESLYNRFKLCGSLFSLPKNTIQSLKTARLRYMHVEYVQTYLPWSQVSWDGRDYDDDIHGARIIYIVGKMTSFKLDDISTNQINQSPEIVFSVVFSHSNTSSFSSQR